MDAIDEKPAGFYFDETGRRPAANGTSSTTQGNHVLAQLDQKPRDATATPWPSSRTRRWNTSKLSVRMKAVEGDVDQARRRHVAVPRFGKLSGRPARRQRTQRAALFAFRDGNRVQFGVKEDLDVKPDQWYTLRVEHRGREVKVYLDDDILIIERERHFRRPGTRRPVDQVRFGDALRRSAGASGSNRTTTTMTTTTTTTKID